MLVTSREYIFTVINEERNYQDRKWGRVDEHTHEVGGWLTLMRKLLSDAESAWAGNQGDHKALDELRKLLAVGIACSEQHGLPVRINNFKGDQNEHNV